MKKLLAKLLPLFLLAAAPLQGQTLDNTKVTATDLRGTFQIINTTDLGNIDGSPGNDYRVGGVFFGQSNFGGVNPGDPLQYTIGDLNGILATPAEAGRLVLWDPNGNRWELDPLPAQTPGAGETLAFTALNINGPGASLPNGPAPAIGRGVITLEQKCGSCWVSLYVPEQGTDINATLQATIETHNTKVMIQCIQELADTTDACPGLDTLIGSMEYRIAIPSGVDAVSYGTEWVAFQGLCATATSFKVIGHYIESDQADAGPPVQVSVTRLISAGLDDDRKYVRFAGNSVDAVHTLVITLGAYE